MKTDTEINERIETLNQEMWELRKKVTKGTFDLFDNERLYEIIGNVQSLKWVLNKEE